MEAKDLAVVIIALTAAGVPFLLIAFTVGGLLIGFTVWAVLNFLSQWFVPLIFVGAGLIAFIELISRGPKMVVVGIGVLILFTFGGYFIWSGAFNGPSNTYSLFLSAIPSSQPPPVSGGSLAESLGWLIVAIIIGSGVLIWAGRNIFEGN